MLDNDLLIEQFGNKSTFYELFKSMKFEKHKWDWYNSNEVNINCSQEYLM